jgi:hypothetical protein
MQKMSCVILLMAIVNAVNAELIIKVQPDGDGQNGRARYGYGFPWEDTGFDSSAASNWAGHWYDSPYGASSDVYLQISLSAIPVGATIEKAYLNIEITECSGSGGQIYHRTDSSTANGLASQKLGGDTKIMDISAPAGWLSIDVKSFIQSNLDNGHNWAIFSFPSVGYSSLRFSSGETENAPYLSVSLPEPATTAILSLGALALWRMKKSA